MRRTFSNVTDSWATRFTSSAEGEAQSDAPFRDFDDAEARDALMFKDGEEPRIPPSARNLWNVPARRLFILSQHVDTAFLAQDAEKQRSGFLPPTEDSGDFDHPPVELEAARSLVSAVARMALHRDFGHQTENTQPSGGWPRGYFFLISSLASLRSGGSWRTHPHAGRREPVGAEWRPRHWSVRPVSPDARARANRRQPIVQTRIARGMPKSSSLRPGIDDGDPEMLKVAHVSGGERRPPRSDGRSAAGAKAHPGAFALPQCAQGRMTSSG